MNKFKVGDRVVVYDNGTRRKGSIVDTLKDTDLLWVQYDDESVPYGMYSKQCRKLKSKSKKEYWLVQSDYCPTPYVYLSKEDAKAYCVKWNCELLGQFKKVE